MNQIGTFITGFVVGALTGATATYLGALFTDRRRQREGDKQRKRDFDSIRRQMPDLIAEMQHDLALPEHEHTREFVVVTAGTALNFGRPILRYHTDKHRNLEGKLKILENVGFIRDSTEPNVTKFTFSEEFVHLLRRR